MIVNLPIKIHEGWSNQHEWAAISNCGVMVESGGEMNMDLCCQDVSGLMLTNDNSRCS